MYEALRERLPAWLRRRLLYFEAAIEESLSHFASELPDGARVLDAGAGELRYAHLFARHRYLAVDLGVGDAAWDYTKLHCLADLSALPLAAGSCDACVNIVTLEHVQEPAAVLAELARALRPGGRLLLVVPQEWEVHQPPHDYWRFTRYGVRYLLDNAGFTAVHVYPVGGWFRLMSRRLLNGLQFFRGIDGLDRQRNFTLGYLCTAVKRS
jgi:SAM-dependent methyltransferase